MSNVSNSSIYSAWSDSSKELDTFFNRMVIESYRIFNDTVQDMTTSLEQSLFGSLSNLTTDLLYTFGIYDVFNGANQLITNVNDITQSMQFIIDNTNYTVAQINYQTGFLKAITSLLTNGMTKVCNKLPSNSNCFSFLNNLSQFQVVINPGVINADSSITMLFLLNQMKLNITSIAIKFYSIQTDFNNGIVSQTKANIQNLNFAQKIGQISSIWQYFNRTFSPWKNDFASITSSITSYINTYGLYIFVAISVLHFMIAVILILYALALYRYCKLYYLERKLLTNFMNISQIISTYSINFLALKGRVHNLKHIYNISNYIIYSYLIISSSVIILVMVISLMIINAGHLLYNEVCVQLWRPEGLLISDDFLNIFLNNNWNNLMTFILSSNLPIQFTFPQPTNVISSILKNCSKNNGILYALQMTNFVNISSFLWTPQNLVTLNNGLNITYGLLVGNNIQSVLPQDMTSLLNSATRITVYFDQVNYQPSIDELSNGVIVLKNYSNWVVSAIQYLSGINTPDSNETVNLLNTLYEDIPNIQNLEIAVINLRNNFQIVQNRRSTTKLINTLLFNISMVPILLVDSPATYKIVNTIYNQRMLNEFPNKAEAPFNLLLDNMTNHIFPCVNLSSSIFILLNNLCEYDSAIVNIVSYGINISITCGFFIFMLHFLWYIIRKENTHEREHNVSKC